MRVRQLVEGHAAAESQADAIAQSRLRQRAVDVRQGSPTFLQWHAQVLGADKHNTLLIAEGFAHGFQTLTTDCEMLYLHTAAFQPAAEGGLNARDSRLAIDWPQAISELSPRDAAHPMVDEEFMGVAI